MAQDAAPGWCSRSRTRAPKGAGPAGPTDPTFPSGDHRETGSVGARVGPSCHGQAISAQILQPEQDNGDLGSPPPLPQFPLPISRAGRGPHPAAGKAACSVLGRQTHLVAFPRRAAMKVFWQAFSFSFSVSVSFFFFFSQFSLSSWRGESLLGKHSALGEQGRRGAAAASSSPYLPPTFCSKAGCFFFSFPCDFRQSVLSLQQGPFAWSQAGSWVLMGSGEKA